MDIFPGEYVGNKEKEKQFSIKIAVGDSVKVVVDSQFSDVDKNGNKLPRCFGKTGVVTDIDESDEWAYKLTFSDNTTNWFKRYQLEK